MISITYSNGQVLQGVVLAFGDRLVRVALKDSDDAAEFRLINHVWVSEDCEIVRFEFMDNEAPAGISEEQLLETLFPTPLHHVHPLRVM